MAFQPVPNGVLLEWRVTLPDAVEAENRIYVTGSVIDQSTIDALTDFVDNQIHTTFKPLWHTGITYRETYARDASQEFGVESTNDDNAGAGTRSGTALPNETSLCLSLRTGFTGRSARGRMYWMPLVEADTSSPNIVIPASAGAIVTVLENFRTGLLAQGWTWVIAQKVSDGVPLDEAITRPVTNIVLVDTILDSQRGRKPK